MARPLLIRGGAQHGRALFACRTPYCRATRPSGAASGCSSYCSPAGSLRTPVPAIFAPAASRGARTPGRRAPLARLTGSLRDRLGGRPGDGGPEARRGTRRAWLRAWSGLRGPVARGPGFAKLAN